jgi:hypothetical protein
MDLAGEEKRIRALFSELALEDQSVVPGFEQLWQQAATTKQQTVRSRSLLLIAAALVITTCSLALWSRYRAVGPSVSQSIMSASARTIFTAPLPPAHEESKVTPRKHGLPKHLARQTRTDRSVIRDAVLLASWQSPTGSFLQSPAIPAFKSLPQLNQSVKELESFLPTNDAKESKP